jgi:hypothetical protein
VLKIPPIANLQNVGGNLISNTKDSNLKYNNMEPTTVLTCIQVASSVAGMLSPKGPGIGDLLNIQTQMIKNISAQVETVQKGINQIILDIDNLKSYITYSVPSLIYKEFVTNTLVSKFSGYERIKNTYLYERTTNGIYISYLFNKDKLSKILDDIQSVRDQALNINDFFIAPIAAMCLKIEVDLLIILYGKELGDVSTKFFEESLAGYEKWLVEMQDIEKPYSVDFKIDELKKDIDKANKNVFGYRMCITEHLKESTKEHGIKDDYDELYQYKVKSELFSFQRKLIPEIENDLNSIKISIDELNYIYSKTAISLDYLPQIITPTVKEKFKEEHLEYSFRDFHTVANPGDGVKAHSHYGDVKDERYGFLIDRNYLMTLKRCDVSSEQIYTNPLFHADSERVKTSSKKMVIAATHKKIMMDMQDKINLIKTEL